MSNHEAIYNTHPNVITIDDGLGGAFDVDGNSVVLDESLVSAEETRLQAEYDSLAYARSRKTEYPTIEECVHAILDDDLAALQVKRQAVKDKYPK